ncbi:MAG: XdhC family protein [Acidobacteria bacterium]|nr:XdhC family protein [Acidobacteriota bacterium]
MDILLSYINQALANDEEVILVTIIETSKEPDFNLKVGQKRLLLANGTAINSLGEPNLDLAIDREISFRKQNITTLSLWTDKFQSLDNSDFVKDIKNKKSPKVRIAIEIIRPQPYLLICGAGHIARALTQLGRVLGFRSIVIDDREEFANRNYFSEPSIELKAEAFEQAIKSINISPSMSIVIVTRGHKYDEDCLRLLLGSKASYIGMIGSRRRIVVVKEKLLLEGFSLEQLSKIYAPIGLDIGARTPEEIALTILAEIVLVRNRGERVVDCHPLSRLAKRE